MTNKIKLLCVGGFAAAALVGTSQQASASVMVTIAESGGPSVACNSLIGGCAASWTANPAFGATATQLQFTGTVGDFSIGASVSSTASSSTTTAELDVTNLTVRNTSLASHVLTIDVTGFGFSVPPAGGGPSPMTLVGFQSTTSAPSTLYSTTAQSFADFNNGLGSNNNPTASCTLTLAGSANCDEGSLISWSRNAGPFSLRTLLTITLGAGQSVNLTENTTAQAVIVPEPASLLLLGSGLLIVGRKLRKKTAKA